MFIKTKHCFGFLRYFYSVIFVIACLTSSFVYAQAQAEQQQPKQDDTVAQSNLRAFTSADIAFLKRFSLSALPALPAAPGNRYADDQAVAVLGKKLFFDKRLSKRKRFSCASCHQPEQYFTDGLAVAEAFGQTRRSTPTLLGVAWSPWQYWDGRKDSLWAQALGPIEDPKEMDLARTGFVRSLLKHHGDEYEAVFGPLEAKKQLRRLPKKASPLGDEKAQKRWQKLKPETQQQVNRIFTNAGKAMMAYQRQLSLPRTRFDDFIDGLDDKDSPSHSLLSDQEVRGLRLFMGKANCASCHNGPLFTNFEFHNIGAPEADESNVDLGRYSGVKALVEDEFTCLSQWSDAAPGQCEEMQFLKRTGPELVGAFKTPTLRNITQTAPYMQAGQFANLAQVLAHYNLPRPPFYDREQHPNRPHFDILPLKLEAQELIDIEAFLATLTSPYPQDDFWWNEKGVSALADGG